MKKLMTLMIALLMIQVACKYNDDSSSSSSGAGDAGGGGGAVGTTTGGAGYNNGSAGGDGSGGDDFGDWRALCLFCSDCWWNAASVCSNG